MNGVYASLPEELDIEGKSKREAQFLLKNQLPYLKLMVVPRSVERGSKGPAPGCSTLET